MKKTLVVIVALLFALSAVGISMAATAKKVADDQVPADMKAQQDQKAKQKPGQYKEKAGAGQMKEKPGQLKYKDGAPGQTKVKDSKAGQFKEKVPEKDQKANTVR